jgi:hypothetical protein
MIKAPITPGIDPQSVRMKTNTNEPQPLSIIANGGKMMHSITLQIDIVFIYSKGLIYKIKLLTG